MAEDSPKIEISFTKKELIELAYILNSYQALINVMNFNRKEEVEACKKYQNRLLNLTDWAVLDE